MLKRVSSIASAILLTFSFSFCMTACDNQAVVDPAPDYSGYNLKFDFYGNGMPNDGRWWIDNIEYSLGKDMRTVEIYQDYKDVGMTQALLGSSVVPHWCKSKEEFLEQNLDALTALNSVGLDNIIMCDYRYTNILAKVEGGLIGEGKRFATEADLDAFLTDCISWYKDIPGINAVSVCDEPSWNSLESFGQLYQALERVWPEAEKYYNFFPMCLGDNAARTIGPLDQSNGETQLEAGKIQYEKYLRKALSYISEDDKYVSYDSYPFIPSGINADFMPSLEVAAKVAKDLGVELHTYAQTCSMYNGSSLQYRQVEEYDARWINNMYLGFGTHRIGYFQYKTAMENSSTGESFVDGASMVTWRHEKTDLYYAMQKIMAENQKFAPTILNFDYQGHRSYVKQNCAFPASHMKTVDNSYTFKAVKDISIDKECALATEMYDAKNGYYMYMFMNAVDPINKGSKAYQTSTITFDSAYKNVVVYKNGVGTPQRLNNGSITVELQAGDAVFLLPY